MTDMKPFSNSKDIINIIIETPQGGRNKFAYDPATDFFKLRKVLPLGMTFPLDFGFIPGTQGEDGDPLDAMVMMERGTYPGCLVECRIIGIIEAEQKEKGKPSERNDRIIAIPEVTCTPVMVKHIKDIDKNFLRHLFTFFEQYNMLEHKKFSLLGLKGPQSALKTIRKYSV